MTLDSACAQSFHIICGCPSVGIVRHGGQLTPLLPGECLAVVGKRITNGVIGNGLAIVGCQQIAPFGIAVDVGNGRAAACERPSGIGVRYPANDVAGIIVYPDPCLPGIQIVLPNQLVGKQLRY